MGDNREHSSDSRILSHVGYVPRDNLVGKAALIFYQLSHQIKVLVSLNKSFKDSKIYKKLLELEIYLINEYF